MLLWVYRHGQAQELLHRGVTRNFCLARHWLYQLSYRFVFPSPVLFGCVYGKKLTIFPCQSSFVPTLVMPAFGQGKFVRVPRKSWQVYKKYFYGFGKQKVVLTRDKCLTTFLAHEQQNLSRKIYWLCTREGKLIKENLSRKTCQGKCLDCAYEKVNLSRKTCPGKLVKENLLTVHTRR
jgi:hypothetical protein